MIIDAHAHVVAPDSLYAFRANLMADGGYFVGKPKVSDDALAVAAQSNIDVMDGVGTDVQLISPRPYYQGHSMQPARLVDHWIGANNDVIARTVALHPSRFAGVAGLPIAAGQPVDRAFPELRRAVEELGFVGVTVNPDPYEGTGTAPALGDPYWYPLYEQLIELDVPLL